MAWPAAYRTVAERLHRYRWPLYIRSLAALLAPLVLLLCFWWIQSPVPSNLSRLMEYWQWGAVLSWLLVVTVAWFGPRARGPGRSSLLDWTVAMALNVAGVFMIVWIVDLIGQCSVSQ